MHSLCVRFSSGLIVLVFLLGPSLAQDTAGGKALPPARDSLLEPPIRAYSEGAFEKAITMLLEVRDTLSGRWNFYLGMAYCALNDYENAIGYLRRAVEVDSSNGPRRFQLARALEQSGAAAEARAEYQTVIHFDSGYFPAVFQLGLSLYGDRAFPEAERAFRYAVGLNVRDFLSYYHLGMCCVAEGKNDSARALFSACMSLNPKYLPAITALAMLHYGDGNFTEALRLYKMGSQIRPDLAEMHFRTALCYQHLGNHPEAVACFRRVIEKDSLNGACWGQLGYSLYRQDDFVSAVSAYRRAVEIDKDNPLYYYNIALALERMDSTGESVAMFHRALAAYHPENLATVYVQLGTLYYLQKQYRSALSAYQHALENRPEDKIAQYYLALAYDQLHDSANAVRQYQKFLTLTYDDSSQNENRATVQHRLKYLKRK